MGLIGIDTFLMIFENIKSINYSITSTDIDLLRPLASGAMFCTRGGHGLGEHPHGTDEAQREARIS
jgi:hypothetical protein